jgi:hypothetical protein
MLLAAHVESGGRDGRLTQESGLGSVVGRLTARLLGGADAWPSSLLEATTTTTVHADDATSSATMTTSARHGASQGVTDGGSGVSSSAMEASPTSFEAPPWSPVLGRLLMELKTAAPAPPRLA